MTKLYFHPVSDEWLPYFEDTVEQPLNLSNANGLPERLSGLEQARVWGTTYETKKERYLDDMEAGDLVLFYRNKTFFAAGRVQHVFKSAAFGEWAWDNEESELVYTLTDYEEISLPSQTITSLLGYSDNYRVQGFFRPREERLQNLLETYDSIDNAFADLKNTQTSLTTEHNTTTTESEQETTDNSNKELVDDEPVTPTAPYYWVNHNTTEIEEEYLRASRTTFPNYDLQKLEVGDIVFNYVDGAVVGYSEVVRPAYIVKVDGEEKRQVDIDVHRFPEPVPFVDVYPYLWRADVRLDKYYPVGQGGVNSQYLYNLSKKAGEYLLEQGKVSGSNVDRLQTRLDLSAVSVSLPDNLYFHDGEQARLRQQITAALNAGKHIIFTGPPGTGKSRIAKHVAQQVVDDQAAVDGYTFTTATAEWSSFDTIGGYVPSQNNSELEFDPRLFLKCFRDNENTVQNRWLIIDELNRANIDKALGPLFSVLSQDSVELPYEREGRVRVDWIEANETDEEDNEELVEVASDPDRFPVTSAWRLLGTMNTFDKTSLYDLSFAFMRRFSFIHVGVPDLTTDNDVVSHALLDPDAGPNYATIWQRQRPHLVDVIDDYHDELAVLWAIINEYRSIGPAIILDMLEQIAAFEGGDQTAPMTSAIINYVFPQLEGLRKDDQEDLLEDLADGRRFESDAGSEHVGLSVEVPYLRRKARDMYDLDIDIHSRT